MTEADGWWHAIPYGWFQIAYSEELAPGTVQPLRAFGRDLIAWRSLDGRASVLDAYCPHLGAHLAHGGLVVRRGLRCPFHAWTFGCDGVCVKMPGFPPANEPVSVLALPVVEQAGLVLAWYHPEGVSPSFAPPDLEVLANGERRRFTSTIRTRWFEIPSSALDSRHFGVVHGAKVQLSELEQRGPELRSVASFHRGRVQVRLASVGPGLVLSITSEPSMYLLVAITPIEECMLEVRYNLTLDPQGLEHDPVSVADNQIAGARAQLEEDRIMLEHKRFVERPLLEPPDGEVMRVRRWAAQFST